MNNLLASIFAISLYLVSTVLLMLRCREFSALKDVNKSVLLLPGSMALVAHVYVLYTEMLSPIGINLGFYNSLSLISAFIALMTLALTVRHPSELLSMIVMPMAACMIALDVTSSSSHILAPGSSNSLITHVVTSLVAYSVLALAALHAILLSLQNTYLHGHQPGGFIKLLPPLRVMESILFETITVGFVLLSISLATGLLFLENMFAQQLAHKTVLSILAWFVFAILLYGRVIFGWRGKKAIRWTLGGFFSLMLAYLGSKFVLEVVLV